MNATFAVCNREPAKGLRFSLLAVSVATVPLQERLSPEQPPRPCGVTLACVAVGSDFAAASLTASPRRASERRANLGGSGSSSCRQLL